MSRARARTVTVQRIVSEFARQMLPSSLRQKGATQSVPPFRFTWRSENAAQSQLDGPRTVNRRIADNPGLTEAAAAQVLVGHKVAMPVECIEELGAELNCQPFGSRGLLQQAEVFAEERVSACAAQHRWRRAK